MVTSAALLGGFHQLFACFGRACTGVEYPVGNRPAAKRKCCGQINRNICTGDNAYTTASRQVSLNDYAPEKDFSGTFHS